MDSKDISTSGCVRDPHILKWLATDLYVPKLGWSNCDGEVGSLDKTVGIGSGFFPPAMADCVKTQIDRRQNLFLQPGLTISKYKLDSIRIVEMRRLFNESLGSKSMSQARGRTLTWSVPYQEGTLQAVGKRGKKVACEYVLQTASYPKKLVLEVDKKCLSRTVKTSCHVMFQVTDKNGIQSRAHSIGYLQCDRPDQFYQYSSLWQ